MQLSSLPLATQLLLDPTVILDQVLLDEWSAACVTARIENAEYASAALCSTTPMCGVVRRREPRRQVDTDDFFTLAEALDTLADELNANLFLGSASPPLTTESENKAPHRSLGVDELDPRGMDGLTGAQLIHAREGHTLFLKKEYPAALTALLDVCSACLVHELTPALLNNVAACQYVMEQWEACETTTSRVLSVDPTEHFPSSRRLVRVFVSQGRLQEAQQAVNAHRDATDWVSEVAAVKACEAYLNFYAARQYNKALESLELLLSFCPCGTLEATKARLLSLENLSRAVRYAAQRTRVYAMSTDLHFCVWELTFHSVTSIPGLMALLEDMQAASVGKSELRYRHLHTHIVRCKEAISTLQGLMVAHKIHEGAGYALQLLKEPYLPDGMKGIVYFERARALVQDANWYGALDDVHRALSYTEAVELRASMLLLVARCEEALHRFRDAIAHMEESLRLVHNPKAVEQLRLLKARSVRGQGPAATGGTSSNTKAKEKPTQKPHAQQCSASSTPLDVHYKALSLPSSASAVDVKKSYRALAMKWHPDRWCGASEEAIKKAEAAFKSIQHAYETIMKMFSG